MSKQRLVQRRRQRELKDLIFTPPFFTVFEATLRFNDKMVRRKSTFKPRLVNHARTKTPLRFLLPLARALTITLREVADMATALNSGLRTIRSGTKTPAAIEIVRSSTYTSPVSPLNSKP